MEIIKRIPLPKKANDITGMKLGRMEALYPAENENGRMKWAFRCDCGTEFVSDAHSFTKGTTKSCGCIRRETAKRNIAEYNKHTIIRFDEALLRHENGETKQDACLHAGISKSTFYKYIKLIVRGADDGKE